MNTYYLIGQVRRTPKDKQGGECKTVKNLNIRLLSSGSQREREKESEHVREKECEKQRDK